MMRATSDILSDCLIHKILSFLSFKEAAKMSILSKTWLRAWSTHPNLEFKVDYLNDNMKKVDSIMERYHDGKIPIERFELSDSSYSQEIFPLFDKWLHIALQNGVKDIIFGVPRYTSYTLPIFTIFAAKSLRELVLNGFNLKRVSLSSDVVNYNSLRKLSLSYISLDDNMLQTLLNKCSLIVSLVLEHCFGLEKIELLNLQRIKSVTIKTFRNQRVKIEAPTLEHLYYFDAGEGYPMLDIINAPNLVSLEYIGDQIPKTFVDANLQWNCHPRKIFLVTTSKMISCFMDRLMNMKSSSHESRPLRCKLQEVTTYKFDWENQNWHPVEFEIKTLEHSYYIYDDTSHGCYRSASVKEKLYRYKRSSGSPIVQIFQVILAATRKRKMDVPYDVGMLYKTIVAQGDFVNHDLNPNPWKLYTVTRVEEVKMMSRLIPIWATTILFWTTYAQMITFSVEQAATMEPNVGKFKIPAGSLTVFFVSAILITLIIYDRFIMPLRQKLKGKPGFTSLQKIALGLSPNS
ncbi:hypothetical protein KY285_036660 [Solanum tuberosum]|nr:hypothetical protein KY285_036660 [Solanum tuberosum]